MFRKNDYTVEAVNKKTGELTGKPKKVWALWLILLVEFIGTFAMVFEIIAPSALNLSESTTWYDQIFGTFVMKAFWVAGFILILIFLLRWCSVNLNPAVTLAEVATGHTTKQQAFWMILIQFAGAILAAYAAYWIGMNVAPFSEHAAQYSDGTYTLDAVSPRLLLSQNELQWFSGASWLANASAQASITGVDADGSFALWTMGANVWTLGGIPVSYVLIVAFIEFVFTFLLLWSVVGAQRVSYNARPFLIFAVLMVVVTLGIHTNNIALNPARLFGPAFVAQVTGGAKTLQYVPFFLLGELLAVLLVAKTAGRRSMKAAKKAYKETGVIAAKGASIVTAVSTDEAVAAIRADEAAFKAEVKEMVLSIQEELEITKARYEWTLKGNSPIEIMTLEEVQEAIKAKKAQSFIDLDQPAAILRKEFAKYIGFGPEIYKQMLIESRKKKQLAEIEAKKAKIEADKKAAAEAAKSGNEDDGKAKKAVVGNQHQADEAAEADDRKPKKKVKK